MKKILLTLATLALLSTNALGINSTSADENMMKLVFKSQGLSEKQAQLAFDAVLSLKLLSEEIRANKQSTQSYITSLLDEEEMDVSYMLGAFRQWQKQFDSKLEKTLTAVAALHGELTVEQRKELLQKIQNLSQ